jgi:hypothetical protein
MVLNENQNLIMKINVNYYVIGAEIEKKCNEIANIMGSICEICDDRKRNTLPYDITKDEVACLENLVSRIKMLILENEKLRVELLNEN